MINNPSILSITGAVVPKGGGLGVETPLPPKVTPVGSFDFFRYPIIPTTCFIREKYKYHVT